MTKQVKEKKKKLSYKKLVRKFIAKPVAFTAVFVTCAYGINQMLDTLQPDIANVLTVLLVASLAYIVFFDED